jgi:hypothetical protein
MILYSHASNLEQRESSINTSDHWHDVRVDKKYSSKKRNAKEELPRACHGVDDAVVPLHRDHDRLLTMSWYRGDMITSDLMCRGEDSEHWSQASTSGVCSNQIL